MRKTKILILTISILLLSGSFFQIIRSQSNTVEKPKVFLWEWQNQNNLDFVDAEKAGVAYLSQTLVVNRQSITLYPRRKRLKVNPATYLVAVTRIESWPRNSGFSSKQISQVARMIARTSRDRDIKGIQIDFDARPSERKFYKAVLTKLRAEIPREMTLSITVPVSACFGDSWIKDLPIDEAVPMSFRVSDDEGKIGARLSRLKSITQPLCKKSIGYSFKGSFKVQFSRDRTNYYFASQPWRSEDLYKLN